MTDKIIILLSVIVLGQLLYQICSSFSWRKERIELTKMLAARNYPEYKNMEQHHEKPPPAKHSNMIKAQQKKMNNKERG